METLLASPTTRNFTKKKGTQICFLLTFKKTYSVEHMRAERGFHNKGYRNN